jgi:hypothetical protein
MQQIEVSFGSLRLHFQRQLDAINRNVQRLQVQAPVIRGVSTAAATTTSTAAATIQVAQQEEGRAELCPRPKSLHELWTEYMFGIGGRKAAKDFTPVERGRIDVLLYREHFLSLFDNETPIVA